MGYANPFKSSCAHRMSNIEHARLDMPKSISTLALEALAKVYKGQVST